MPARKVDMSELLESMQYTNQRAVLDESYIYAMIDAVSQYRIAIPYHNTRNRIANKDWHSKNRA